MTHEFRISDGRSLSTSAGVLQDDGTLWSQGCTLGSYVKGGEAFTLDKEKIDNFIRVFLTGSRQKIPVDYDHGVTDNDPVAVQQRAMGKVPKAGDVLEMEGVYSADDFTGELKSAAEKLCAEANPPRELDDSRNLGLWIRWRPTPRALQGIQAREYSELSVCFVDDLLDNKTGEGQGPALLAVALTNLPFLADMLPVAASQRHGGSPAAPGTGDDSTMKTLLTSLAAVIGGSPRATEDEAVADVTKLGTELKTLRDNVAARDQARTELSASLSLITTELGVSDAKTALDRIRSLTAENKRFADAAAAEKKTRIDGEVTTTMKKYEKVLTPALRDEFYGPQLRAELEAGVEIAKAKTIVALDALKPHGIVGRIAGADNDSEGLGGDQDAVLDRKARALVSSDPELKAIADKDWSKAYDLACDRVAKEINYVSSQMDRARTGTA